MELNLAKIKQLRNDNRLSQGDMAEVIGLNNLYPYHRKESGTQSFTAEEIHAIAIFFKRPVEYFFDDKLAINASSEKVV